MAEIVLEEKDTGFGSWVQADDTTPTYVKIVIPGDSVVEVVTSESRGSGAGGTSVVEKVVRSTTSMSLPPGAYYIKCQSGVEKTTSPQAA